MTKLTDEIEKQKKSSQLDYSEEIALLRALLKINLERDDISDAEKLELSLKPTNLIMANIAKLQKLRVARQELVSKDEAAMWVDKLTKAINKVLERNLGQEVYFRVVDEIAAELLTFKEPLELPN